MMTIYGLLYPKEKLFFAPKPPSFAYCFYILRIQTLSSSASLS